MIFHEICVIYEFVVVFINYLLPLLKEGGYVVRSICPSVSLSLSVH